MSVMRECSSGTIMLDTFVRQSIKISQAEIADSRVHVTLQARKVNAPDSITYGQWNLTTCFGPIPWTPRWHTLWTTRHSNSTSALIILSCQYVQRLPLPLQKCVNAH